MRSLGLRFCVIVLFFALAPILFVGCASSGSNYNEQHVHQIQKGVTTESELVQMFGEPTDRTENSDGTTVMVWNYNQIESDKRQFIPYAGVFFAGNNSTTHKYLTVTLRNGKVDSYTSNSGGTHAQQGTQDTPQ